MQTVRGSALKRLTKANYCLVEAPYVRHIRLRSMVVDPEEALSSLGNPWRNPWQMMMYNLIIAPMGIIVAWQMMAIVFIGERALIPI